MEGWGLVVWPAVYGAAYALARILRWLLPPQASVILGNLVYWLGCGACAVAVLFSLWLAVTAIPHGLAWLIFPAIYAFLGWLVFLVGRQLRLVLHDVILPKN